MSDLLALAAEIEALTRPDLDMDRVIAWRLLYPTADESARPGTEFYTAISRGIPRYTKSVDAALALLRDVLPGWSVDMWQRYTHPMASVFLGPLDDDGERVRGLAPTLPLAICAAVVRAVAPHKAER